MRTVQRFACGTRPLIQERTPGFVHDVAQRMGVPVLASRLFVPGVNGLGNRRPLDRWVQIDEGPADRRGRLQPVFARFLELLGPLVSERMPVACGSRVFGPASDRSESGGDAGVGAPRLPSRLLRASAEIQNGADARYANGLLDVRRSRAESEEAKRQPQGCAQAPPVSLFREQQERCDCELLAPAVPALGLCCRHPTRRLRCRR